MADKIRLRHPWLVAVWPGMGHVALNAGYYLLSKLGMDVAAELQAEDLFDVEHVDVKHGRIQPARRPRNRFFIWTDPAGRHDLVIFLGEAQPPVGKFAFCKQLIAYARSLGVERVFTFAAMATRMRPGSRGRVFGAATDADTLLELKRLEVELLSEGQISGLNGVLLGAAAEAGLHGACLLGEMPHVFAQLPYPKASLGVLEAFTTMSRIDIDLAELTDQAELVEEQLGRLLEASGQAEEGEDESDEPDLAAAAEEPEPSPDEARIEHLFAQAARNRTKAFELKRELDRLGLFKAYEDRFLDLFRRAG